jgi:hypothetical protein
MNTKFTFPAVLIILQELQNEPLKVNSVNKKKTLVIGKTIEKCLRLD